ncbi:MAG: HD domain-containing protein [Thermodesulfobacteriota bacterium]
MVNPQEILLEYYDPDTDLFRMLMAHNERVAEKSLEAARRVGHLKPDLRFIEEAALLHDIGIFMTDAPALCCHGQHPYLCHGILGRALLEKHGLHRHGLVCERHIGVGITAEEIEKNRLPLPVRDMRPTTVEEEIIAYADKFFSKDCTDLVREHSVEWIVKGLEKHGPDKGQIFHSWVERYENGKGRP